MCERVLLGLSGGVDSFVSAILLQKKGYEVVGITFVFFGRDKNINTSVSEARALSEQINIEHHVVDLRNHFKKNVIEYFIKGYQKGQTPFPCAYCNPKIKFKQLHKYAEIYKCNYIATGHYCKIKEHNKKKYIFSAKDPEKDQSFFLWGLKNDIIKKLLFPLGDLYKYQVKAIAKKQGFINLSTKKESTGICFVEGRDYRKFLTEHKIKGAPGNFVDEKGNILGKHNGIFNYTIGQRRGLGLNLEKPVFVCNLRLDENEIELVDFNHLFKLNIYLNQYNFVDNEEIRADFVYTVKVRYRHQEAPCKIHILSEHEVRVELLQPESMIAPGQTAVFYDANRMIGGGFISRAE